MRRLSTSPATPGAAAKAGPVAAGDSVQHVSVGSIRPLSNQPRRHFDEAAIVELADSISARGLLQPIDSISSGWRLQHSHITPSAFGTETCWLLSFIFFIIIIIILILIILTLVLVLTGLQVARIKVE